MSEKTGTKRNSHHKHEHSHHKKYNLEDIQAILKEANLSITKPRLSILTILLNEHGPFTVEDISKKLPKNFCDLATIYRSINQFVEIGLVNEIHLEKDVVHFEYNNPEHHHHHIVCKSCKKIESLDECFLDKIETLLTKKGYANIGHHLEFFGLCPKCQ